jgi:release factor glutamine methyltransferase
MTLQKARYYFGKELGSFYGGEELQNISGLVLEHITGWQLTLQIKNNDFILTPGQEEQLNSVIQRLKTNEPVQYVLGEAWFAGMKFKVNKHVLIPRPETEELVEWVVKESQKSTVKSQKILDIGTGSGCIAVSLKKKFPLAQVEAVDVCSEALFTSTENALNLDAEVEFRLLDFLDEEKWNELGQYDIIVSNPPYVRQSEVATMHKRVTGFEPQQALFVPNNDALLFYRKLSAFAKAHLKPGGSLFVEINENLGKEVVSLFQSAGLKNIELKKDMQGKDRMVKANRM